MKPNYYLLAAGAAALFLLCRSKRPTGLKESDSEVSIENIRRGVANGWYTAELWRNLSGEPFVILTGNTADGNDYVGTYPIAEEDWQTLKSEGYKMSEMV